MGSKTEISWTNHTFNPWWGCTKVSPGCDHCYAESFDRRVGGAHWGKGVPRREFKDAHWSEPLKWNKDAQAEGKRSMVFCASMADVMDDECPSGARERLWELIDNTPYLIWQLLTKRPHRYPRYLPATFAHNNVWLGATAENQDFYNVRWSILRIVADDYGLTSWISYEPALGAISMDAFAVALNDSDTRPDYPNWIIFGGESGPGRRPVDRIWADQIRHECGLSGTRFFMKQMGGATPAAGSRLIPSELLIREFPA
jgi:protein gp37